MIKIVQFTLFGLLLLMNQTIVYAHGHDQPHEMKPSDHLAVSVAFDANGTLWQVGVNDGFVVVSSSQDVGKTFSKAVRVNPDKQHLTAKGEVRPKIAVGPQGEIYITWMQNLTKRFSGYIWFSRSLDGGKRFEKPIIVHQDRAEIDHAFEELSVAPDGKITILWLAARDLVADKSSGKARHGSAVYYAVSSNQGKSFSKEAKLADYACECCRIATTTKPDGTVVAMWRHVFEGGERDHMMAEVPNKDAAVQLHRATYGHWKIDGCPHHGGALARGGEGADWWGYHMAYFDGQDKKPGLYYSRMDGEAWVTFPAKAFGNLSKQARHPSILSQGNQVWLAWLETAGKGNIVMVKSSKDSGKTWSNDNPLLTIAGKTDYPQLLTFKAATYLVVNTEQGLVLQQLLTP